MVTITSVDLDRDLLAEAKNVIGSTTMKDTINKALWTVVQQARQREALKKIRTLPDLGDWFEVKEEARR
jgi:Arc/MetJ family transcription regulator